MDPLDQVSPSWPLTTAPETGWAVLTHGIHLEAESGLVHHVVRHKSNLVGLHDVVHWPLVSFPFKYLDYI